MSATLTALRNGQPDHDPADPIDRLMLATGGEILKVGTQTGGEYDSLQLVGKRDRRRLAGAHLVSTAGGMRPDVLQHTARHALPELDGMNPDEFVTWYVAQCLVGLDYRASKREGNRWVDTVRPDDEFDPTPTDFDLWDDSAFEALLDDDSTPTAGSTASRPEWFTAWVARTVHAPKAELLTALGAWSFEGAPYPNAPAAPWVDGLVRKFTRRLSATDSYRERAFSAPLNGTRKAVQP